jgi:hypothetical protein
MQSTIQTSEERSVKASELQTVFEIVEERHYILPVCEPFDTFDTFKKYIETLTHDQSWVLKIIIEELEEITIDRRSTKKWYCDIYQCSDEWEAEENWCGGNHIYVNCCTRCGCSSSYGCACVFTLIDYSPYIMLLKTYLETPSMKTPGG